MTPAGHIERRDTATHAVIDVTGEIIVGDDGFAEAFASHIQAIAAGEGPRNVLVAIDARQMTSTAIGALITGWQRVQSGGGRFAVHTRSATLRAVFRVLQHVGIFFDSEAAALEHLQQA